MVVAESTDVVIVGAGLSGLTAARDIQRAGFSCIVLEAEDRVGGMTLSVKQDSGVAIDTGAAWLNNTTQSHIWGLVQEFGLTAEPQDSEGELLREMQDGSIITGTEGNKQLTPDELKAMASFYAQMGQLIETVDPDKPHEHPDAAELDNMTLAEFCQKKSGNDLVLFLLNSSVRYLLGAEADEISALWFFSYCKAGTGLQNMMSARKDGGQHLRLREGTQTIAQNLASSLHPNTIRLSTPATSITHSAHGCTTTTTAANPPIRSHRVILTLPSPLHQTITFTPPLPPPNHALASAAHMGFSAKVTLVYPAPWWRAAGLSAIFESALGPVIYSRSTSVPSAGHHSITGFVVGAPGRRWSALPAAERRAAVLRQLGNAFGAAVEGGVVPEPSEYVEEDWSRRAAFGGGPMPVLGKGVLTRVGEGVARTVGAVHFAGAETADVWRGYMEGAVRSGVRSAEEVVAALRRESLGGKL
ncbi:putative flavin-containing amine oxidase protein [Neofusicoccum parvum]|uniref:Flavin-containing amine oxidase protein n=1 Tax=Neofusicoccum parvum TaxID=310453 RepID=A0ACB5SQ55_9PEZI|nr:putative flavin-containing amine oxidase protein [Neofusicoccum parvum]